MVDLLFGSVQGSGNAWLATTALGRGKNKVIDTAAAEFVAACSKLDPGSKKPVDKIAVEWGLSDFQFHWQPSVTRSVRLA